MDKHRQRERSTFELSNDYSIGVLYTLRRKNERERERGGERDRDRETERDRESERQRERVPSPKSGTPVL